MIQNKKAQTGDTITWLVATIAIVVILLGSILMASFTLGKIGGVTITKQADTLATKSFFSWLLTKDANGQTVAEQIKTDKNLGDDDGQLALNIFNTYYKPDYAKLWVGVIGSQVGQRGFVDNKYFGSIGIPSSTGNYPAGQEVEQIKLSNEEIAAFVFIKT